MLTDLVMADNPQMEPSQTRRLMLAAASGMVDERRSAELAGRFHELLGQIELGFILEPDGGPYLADDRKQVLAILREIAGTLHST